LPKAKRSVRNKQICSRDSIVKFLIGDEEYNTYYNFLEGEINNKMNYTEENNGLSVTTWLDVHTNNFQVMHSAEHEHKC
jgi:hypothetical protein